MTINIFKNDLSKKKMDGLSIVNMNEAHVSIHDLFAQNSQEKPSLRNQMSRLGHQVIMPIIDATT